MKKKRTRWWKIKRQIQRWWVIMILVEKHRLEQKHGVEWQPFDNPF